MRDSKQSVSVSIGENVAVIRRSGNSSPTIAGILGQSKNRAGQARILWLDRIVHRIGESEFDDGQSKWLVSGAVSSILTRKINP